VVRPEIQTQADRIVAGFRRECLRVLDEAEGLRAGMAEPPEGWREYFTRRIYTALLRYKEEIEEMVAAHLAGGGRG
jgi:hypothetical protein